MPGKLDNAAYKLKKLLHFHTHVVYVPFAHGNELVDFAVRYWNGRNKKYVVKVHGQSNQPLKGVVHDAPLYVSAHGHAGSMTVSDGQGNRLSPKQLAVRILGDGLGKGHQLLKMWGCEAAFDPYGFVYHLYNEMTALGYAELVVQGYNHSISVPKSYNGQHKAAVFTDHAGNQHNVGKASEYRVTYSKNGIEMEAPE